MYKLLLSWRYLRTRHIALASIISVTLGVATLIVVNAVMAGFTTEMHKRLHGILSDVVFEGGMNGFADPDWYVSEVKRLLGDDLESISAAVHVPAMITYQVRGQWITRELIVIGIDESSYPEVSDFRQFLMNPENRERLTFRLPEGHYDERLPESGWNYRRQRAAFERAYREQQREAEEARSAAAAAAQLAGGAKATGPDFSQLPTAPTGNFPSESGTPDQNAAAPRDPFAAHRPVEENQFDPGKEQFTGVILGMAIASVRQRDTHGDVKDFYLCRPGDDVKITFPSSGIPPQAVSDNFTIVDLYESKMSEYDSKFAFVPLKKLQQLRGMIDPATGTTAVTSIQMKLKPGADLDAVRDKLRAHFPPEIYPFRVATWRDLQGPLLQAVSMETIILNLLLFLIIAVAGFGILATFFMIVVEKTRDVGILKALGAPNRGVMSIFISYGFVLGLTGSGAGAIGGVLFVWYINDIAAFYARCTGREIFDPTIYYFQEIPTILSPLTVAWIMAGSVVIAVLASVLPALRAARLHPVEALRYE